jgi:hypothetical protein
MTTAGIDNLIGTNWRHKKKGAIYTVSHVDPERGNVYLTAKTKNRRSTWKWISLLAYDYEQVGQERKNYISRAKKRWHNAVWIEGEGRYALLAHCRELSISLWATMEEAESEKKILDKFGCGGMCDELHEIIDMDGE